MLSKAEVEKHEKRENKIQENLAEWDKTLFGSEFECHEMIFDNLHTFLDIRCDKINIFQYILLITHFVYF